MSYITYEVRVYDDSKEWRLNGQLHREDGPAVEWDNGTNEWFLNDKLHREDGPAIEYANGSKEWWLNGNLHRIEGPAVEYANGSKEWWLCDVRLSEQKWKEETKMYRTSLGRVLYG